MPFPSFTLSKAAAHLRGLAAWEARHHPFKPVDVPLCLMLVVQAGAGAGIALKHLHADSPCASPTAVNWIKRLVECGWVQVVRDDADRRARRVNLTAAGEAFLIGYCDALTARSAADPPL